MKLKKLILIGALCLGFAIGGAACSSEAADTEYSVKFIADGKTIGTVNYTESNTDITAPGVPEKLHYIGAWEAYTLTSGDVVVNAVYTPKTYEVSWYDGETQVGTTQSWQYSETLVTAPAVPEKEGKNGAWGEYVYDETNNTVKVSAVYTDKQYSVQFVADGKTVATLSYTVSNKNIEEPDVPEKKHYNGVWEEYTLTSGDMVVNAVYTAKTYKIRFVAANGDLVSEVNYTVEDTSIDEPEVPAVEGYTGEWKDYALDGGDKEIEPEYTAIMCSVSYLNEDGSLSETVSVQWGKNAENKAITAQAGKIGVWVDSENEPYDFSQAVKRDLSLKAKLYVTTVEVKKSLEMGVTTDEAYTFGESYGIKLVPLAWTTTFRFIESGLAEAAVYKFDAILGGMGDADLAIYYCEGSNWDSRVLLHTFTAANEKATLYLTKAQYQSLVADTADLEYCVKEYQGSVTAKMALYVSKVSVFVDKATIEATNGCTLGYDTAFTFGNEKYSSKLTGKGWTMDIKLCGDQMDATAYDYVVFQIYTTDFKCNCENQEHAGTQALRDLPETSYSDKFVALKDSVWTEIILKVADYNALISNQSRLRIHNSCTAAGKEVWISQPKGVKSESWFTGGTQSVSVANSYNGKPTTSVKNSGWSVDLTVTTATEHTTGNMVFYIKTNNYAKGHDGDHAVKINDKWYSSAIVVGEWMKVTIPVSVWNDECVTGGKQIRINDSNNNANVVYYISEVVWEATPIKVTIEGKTQQYLPGSIIKVFPSETERLFVAWYLNGSFYSYDKEFDYTVGEEEAEFTAIYGEEYITATSGTLSYDSEFTFGDEEYSSKLTGNGWTIDIKLCGEQMDEAVCDFVVFQIYTTDFKCTCGNNHAGTQALRDLPTTSYTNGYISLGNAVWTEVVLKVADYNALISNQSRLRIHNNCTAHGKEVWISQPKGVKSESWFTGGTQSISVANSYNGKPTTSVKNSGWSVDLTVTTATEHTSGNMVFYIKTNNYAKGHDGDHAVKINNKWYSSAIVVGEWMKVTIPVSVWNDECVTGGKPIRINDSNNNANVVYYISEVTWEA